MATVRIYKVAELLGTTSQEVTALLKRDHGIDLKSASSTIEEVVARQFVERLARQRNISLPGGDIFADAPVVKGKKGSTPAKKPAEPTRPVAPPLPPPRLVKTVKPATIVVPTLEPEVVQGVEPEPEPTISEAVLQAEPEPEPEPIEVSVVEEPVPAPAAPVAAGLEVSPPVEEPSVEAPPPPVIIEQPEPAAVEAVVAPPPPVVPRIAPGRLVPPTLRLRIEEQRPTTPPAPLPTVTRSAPRVIPRPAPPRTGPPMSARPGTGSGTGAPGQPGVAGARPPAQPVARPGGPPRPPSTYPSAARPSAPPGGPRPLPSQPVRPPQPGLPPRPGQYPQRPGQHRPPYRPTFAPRSGPRRDAPRPVAQAPAEPPPVTRSITLAEGMTVKDLADKLDIRVKDVLAKLLMKRLMLTINSTLDTDTAMMIAREFGANVEMRSFEQELLQGDADDSRPEDVVTRAPVVTVMGHVDHGKTSLLDAIRETRVAEREAGGITQHIGAYHVTINKRNIVFLDTPGHAAFTLMRARGAKVTDLVVIVVAADDGVMPQTREAIDHARAAGVPIVVAINKVDKPNANTEKVKRELTELDLMPEEWGGKTVTVEVSAKKKQNIELLLEMILLVTDIGELKANPKRSASGTVLEAKLDKGRGPVATYSCRTARSASAIRSSPVRS